MKKRLTTKEFIDRCNEKHSFKYDYSLVEYVRSSNKVIIICKNHGSFSQLAQSHLAGQGCMPCSRDAAKTQLNDWLSDVNEIHKNKYDYSLVKYKNNYTRVEIICKEHGVFTQTPRHHYLGNGCHKCWKLYVKSQDKFVEQAGEVHKNKYDYSKAKYITDKIKVEIICSDHGSFFQAPNNHLKGMQCPRCRSTVSISENNWLDYINVPQKFRHKTLKIDDKNYFVDAYNPLTNTIYEFDGDFWHGNPNKYNGEDINVFNKKTFGELYDKTIERRNRLIKKGYNVISIWESDFNNLIKIK